MLNQIPQFTQKLRDILKQKRLDCICLHLSHPTLFKYLGVIKEQGFFIITPKTAYFLLSPLDSLPKTKIRIQKLTGPIDFESFKGRIGICANTFTLKQWSLFKKCSCVSIDEEIDSLREIKANSEIQKIKKACKHTDMCFTQLIQAFPTFHSENDAVKFIRMFAFNHNLELAFDPIIASGKNAAIPHHNSADKLSEGFCVIDFGFSHQGYKSDMTRTIYIGKPSEEETERYYSILQLQESLCELCIPQMPAKQLHAIASHILGEQFIHSLGHGVGINIHEFPQIGPKATQDLNENMVITIEPGIYVPNKYGIRIEDTVVVQNKPLLLTKSPKALICVQTESQGKAL